MSSKLPNSAPETQAAAGTQPPITSNDPNAEAARPSVGGEVSRVGLRERVGGVDWRQYVVYIGFSSLSSSPSSSGRPASSTRITS